MNYVDIQKESEKREFLNKFNIEKSIEGTEAFEMNQDIMKGIDESEILEKARTGYYKNIQKPQNNDFQKAEQTKAQKDKVAEVMSEFKSGTLKSSSGEKVTSKEQAIAIALSEAGITKSSLDDIEKGKPAQIGEIRDWGGHKYKKVSSGKWEEVKGSKQEYPKNVIWSNSLEYVQQKVFDLYHKNNTTPIDEKKLNRIFSHNAKFLSNKNPFTNPKAETITKEQLKEKFFDDKINTLKKNGQKSGSDVKGFSYALGIDGDILQKEFDKRIDE